MIERFQKYKFELLILFFGVLTLALLNFFLQLDIQTHVYADSDNYLVASKNLMVYFRGHDYRPILMSAINGVPFLFGASDATVYVFSFYVNVFCWLATAVLLFHILKDFSTARMAFYCTLIFYTSVGAIAVLYHLLSETIYTFFIVLSMFFLMKYYRNKKILFLSLALSILICSMLIRPGSKWIAFVFGIYFIKVIVENYAKKAMLFIYGSILLVLIQCAGLYHQFGSFTISYIDGVTYYNYIGAKAMSYKDGVDYTEIDNPRANNLLNLGSHDEIQKVVRQDVLDQLKNNKLNLLKAYFSDIYDNTVSGSAAIADCQNKKNTRYFDFSKDVIFDISKWQNRFFTLFGGILALFYFVTSYRKEVFFTLLSSFILYIIAVSGITFSQGDRFHMVFFPLVIVLTAKFLKDKGKIR
jgi:hypothetical protein